MKKKMSNRDKTFWAVVIPVVVLFFAFNTLPMIKGVIYKLYRPVYRRQSRKELSVYL